MTLASHDNFTSLVVQEKSQVHPSKCWVESITPRFATGHQRLKRGETGATLIAQISVPLATDYGQRKRTLVKPSSSVTCERADTQGSKHDQGSHDTKSVVEVLEALIRTRRTERFLKSETKAGKERVNHNAMLSEVRVGANRMLRSGRIGLEANASS